MLYLYHLTRREEAGHDEAVAFVIAASSTESARNFAASQCGDEGTEVWFDPEKSNVTHVGDALPEDRPGIIIRNFRAG